MTEKQAVKELGEKIGYGNMMYLASELWKEQMIKNDYPTSGVLVPALPCDLKKELKEVAEEIKSYVRTLDTPDNDIYRNNQLLIESCFAKALEIIEKKNKCTGI